MKLMKIQLMLTAAAALLLGGCTTYETRGYSSYGTRVHSDGYDSGDYYGRRYRDDGGYYDRNYDDRARGYGYRQREVHNDVTVVHEQHNATVGRTQVSHATVSH